jgi:SfnB family sulfur acquisition oxidoreductase
VTAAVSTALDLSVPSDVRVIASDEEAITAAGDYARLIGVGALERDRERSLPLAELRELARTGLLGIRVPASHGGAGASSATVAEVFRLIAVADPAIAQIPQNHFAFVELLVRNGSARQRDFFLEEFLEGARLGNALSERGGQTSRDFITRLEPRLGGGYRLSGRKYYCTGALTAQWLPTFALDEHDEVAVAYVPREAAGVEVLQDWNAIGQRATISGTAIFEDVEVSPQWVIPRALGGDGSPSTFAAFGQLMHVAVDVGIARGALNDGAAFLRERARPWWEAGVDRAAEDPQIQRLAGELDTQVRAAEALLERAAVAVDTADATAGDVDAITEARLAVAAAKAFAGEVALHVASAIFDFSGSSAADARHGLDRHWRNARTHTLHDPARSKHLHLGRHVIDGLAPPAAHTLL